MAQAYEARLSNSFMPKNLRNTGLEEPARLVST